jgi:hypothetical protein
MKHSNIEQVNDLEMRLKKEKQKRQSEFDSRLEKRSKMVHELEQRDHLILRLRQELMSVCDQDISKLSVSKRHLIERKNIISPLSDEYISDDKTC